MISASMASHTLPDLSQGRCDCISFRHLLVVALMLKSIKIREETEGTMSKSKPLIKHKSVTLEVDRDGDFDRVLIVSTKVILDSDDKDYSSEKLYRLVDEVKQNLGQCDRAHVFNSDDGH